MRSRYFLLLIPLSILIAAGGQSKRHGKPDKKTPVFSYKKDIVPIFKKYCLPCHSEDQMNPSELYFESYDDMMKGGKHGPPIVPGKPDSSLVIRKINPKPPFGDPMPLKAKTPFPGDTLRILREWIAQGAKNN